ncbi:hypothetical protein PABG_11356 [Paracoccidioides brasiliensis Pb03]|nr:hypothetical protein PABG_11356 [Paracoccidioides brasiliensis Pb03]
MPPRGRRARASERRAAATLARPETDAKANGIFHFVSVNPSSELQKSENRSVIRSHASKYIWRQHRAVRADRGTSNSKSSRPPTECFPSPDDLNIATEKRAWPLASDIVKGEESLFLLPLPQKHTSSTTEDDYMVEAGVSSRPGDGSQQVTQYASNVQSAGWNMEGPPYIYKNGYNTATGPLNQLAAYVGEPPHVFPSMLKSSSINKLLRYATFELWPGLVPGASNQVWRQEDVMKSWLPPALANPALFTAFLYGAAGHLQTRKRLESSQVAPQTREEKLEQIISETETIKQLNKMMFDPQQLCTDEIILAVLCMAFNKINYSVWTTNTDTSPRVPLCNLQWLHVYGGLSLNDQHVKGLFSLLQVKGGLHKITLPGLAETISTSHIMLTTKYLARPRLPFVPIFKDTLVGKTPNWPDLSLNACVVPFNAVNLFVNLQPIPALDPNTDPNPSDIFTTANLPKHLTRVLRHMQNYTAVIKLYTQGLLPGLELAAIADRRNWIQYQLLSLNSINEFTKYPYSPDPMNASHDCSYDNSIQQSENYKIYEPTRIAAMIFSLIAVYPLPAANRPFRRLCRLMKGALLAAEIKRVNLNNPNLHESCWSGAEEVLLWVVLLGAIAARNTSSEEWFVEQAGNVVQVFGIQSWNQLKEVVERIMWMASVCDVNGLIVWNEISREIWIARGGESGVKDWRW